MNIVNHESWLCLLMGACERGTHFALHRTGIPANPEWLLRPGSPADTSTDDQSPPIYKSS